MTDDQEWHELDEENTYVDEYDNELYASFSL
jgi:hypothetical protein